MKFRRQSKPQRETLRSRKIKPGKVSTSNPRGQASGGWSPFAPPVGRQDIADDVEYEAFDRVTGRWYTQKQR